MGDLYLENFREKIKNVHKRPPVDENKLFVWRHMYGVRACYSVVILECTVLKNHDRETLKSDSVGTRYHMQQFQTSFRALPLFEQELLTY